MTNQWTKLTGHGSGSGEGGVAMMTPTEGGTTAAVVARAGDDGNRERAREGKVMAEAEAKNIQWARARRQRGKRSEGMTRQSARVQHVDKVQTEASKQVKKGLRRAMEKKNNEPGWCNGKDYFEPSLCVHESRVRIPSKPIPLTQWVWVNGLPAAKNAGNPPPVAVGMGFRGLGSGLHKLVQACTSRDKPDKLTSHKLDKQRPIFDKFR
ncbi:hypothetical protein BGW80DRAFT_1254557 [Lactifluus volemus]|nr:hypothetical protein BGW80DRAFT_1254557 [Lactifluus volemus]